MKHLLFVIVILLPVYTFAEQTVYVNSDCTIQGDGTSDSCATSAGGAGAYTTVQYTLRQLMGFGIPSPDSVKIVASGTGENAYYYNSNVLVNGKFCDGVWCVRNDGGRYANITALTITSASPASKYKLRALNSDGTGGAGASNPDQIFAINNFSNNFALTVRDMDISDSYTQASARWSIVRIENVGAGSAVTFERNFIHYSLLAPTWTVGWQYSESAISLRTNAATVPIIIRNNIIANTPSNAIGWGSVNSGAIQIFNNTVVGHGHGVNNNECNERSHGIGYLTGGVATVGNNIVQASRTCSSYASISGTNFISNGRNISQDNGSKDVNYRNMPLSFADNKESQNPADFSLTVDDTIMAINQGGSDYPADDFWGNPRVQNDLGAIAYGSQPISGVIKYVNSDCTINGNGSNNSCATSAGGAGAFINVKQAVMNVCGYGLPEPNPVTIIASGSGETVSYTTGNTINGKDCGDGMIPITSSTNDKYTNVTGITIRGRTPSNKYKITGSGATTIFVINSLNVPITFEDLELTNYVVSGTAPFRYILFQNSRSAPITIQRNFIHTPIKDGPNSSWASGTYQAISFNYNLNFTGKVLVQNNIVVNSYGGAIGAQNFPQAITDSNINIKYNTIVGYAQGHIEGDNTLYCSGIGRAYTTAGVVTTGNIVQGLADCANYITPASVNDGTPIINNISQDATSPNSALRNQILSFAGNKLQTNPDAFALSSADTVAINVGGTGYPVDDFWGNPRRQNDIGAIAYGSTRTCEATQEMCGGACVDKCTITGQTHNPTTCTCECPSGQDVCGGACMDTTCNPGYTWNTSTCSCMASSIPAPPSISLSTTICGNTNVASACPAGEDDRDRDGFTVEQGDCDDTNSNIFPGEWVRSGCESEPTSYVRQCLPSGEGWSACMLRPIDPGYANARYIDVVSGNDSNSGLSPQMPWKTFPRVPVSNTAYYFTNHGASLAPDASDPNVLRFIRIPRGVNNVLVDAYYGRRNIWGGNGKDGSGANSYGVLVEGDNVTIKNLRLYGFAQDNNPTVSPQCASLGGGMGVIQCSSNSGCTLVGNIVHANDGNAFENFSGISTSGATNAVIRNNISLNNQQTPIDGCVQSVGENNTGMVLFQPVNHEIAHNIIGYTTGGRDYRALKLKHAKIDGSSSVQNSVRAHHNIILNANTSSGGGWRLDHNLLINSGIDYGDQGGYTCFTDAITEHNTVVTNTGSCFRAGGPGTNSSYLSWCTNRYAQKWNNNICVHSATSFNSDSGLINNYPYIGSLADFQAVFPYEENLRRNNCYFAPQLNNTGTYAPFGFGKARPANGGIGLNAEQYLSGDYGINTLTETVQDPILSANGMYKPTTEICNFAGVLGAGCDAPYEVCDGSCMDTTPPAGMVWNHETCSFVSGGGDGGNDCDSVIFGTGKPLTKDTCGVLVW